MVTLVISCLTDGGHGGLLSKNLRIIFVCEIALSAGGLGMVADGRVDTAGRKRTLLP